jgi:succinylglutamate desuccinylase
MAIPRPSLRDPKKWSATSSNFTFIGHKEDALVKVISEKLATELKRNVVVVAGIHWDDLTAQEIKIIEDLIQKMSDQILKRLRKRK